MRTLSSHIFLTHGHLDHMGSLRRLYGKQQAPATVYCTHTPAQALARQGFPTEGVRAIAPEDRLAFGGVSVAVMKGAHVRFDPKIILHTALRTDILRYCYNLPGLAWKAMTQREHKETLVYCIRADGKTVLLMGSLNLSETAAYPVGVDVLILPCQGKSNLVKAVLPILERLRPKVVLADHFDNAFPPISSTVDLQPIRQAIQQSFPGIALQVPEYGHPIRLNQGRLRKSG